MFFINKSCLKLLKWLASNLSFKAWITSSFNQILMLPESSAIVTGRVVLQKPVLLLILWRILPLNVTCPWMVELKQCKKFNEWLHEWMNAPKKLLFVIGTFLTLVKFVDSSQVWTQLNSILLYIRLQAKNCLSFETKILVDV